MSGGLDVFAPAPSDDTERAEAVANFRVLADGKRALERMGVIEAFVQIHAKRQWRWLGYDTFDEACEDLLGGWRPSFDTKRTDGGALTERQEVVADLTQRGLSTRAIGAALGVTHPTVISDQRAATGRDLPVDPRPVVGLDGRTRTYGERNPITPEAAQAAEDVLGEPFTEDDFPEPDPEPGFSKPELDALDMLSSGRSVVVSMSLDAILGGRLWPWAQQQGIAVRIDRKSKWGNPFIVGEDGDRARVISLFTEHYLPYKALDLGELQGGKVLGCWCAPLPCHGDALLAEV